MRSSRESEIKDKLNSILHELQAHLVVLEKHKKDKPSAENQPLDMDSFFSDEPEEPKRDALSTDPMQVRIDSTRHAINKLLELVGDSKAKMYKGVSYESIRDCATSLTSMVQTQSGAALGKQPHGYGLFEELKQHKKEADTHSLLNKAALELTSMVNRMSSPTNR